MPRKQPLLLLAVAAVAAGGSAAVASAAAVAVSGAAAPSAVQLKMLRAGGLSQFMHFSVDPFTSIEHNCVGTSGKCVPASAFAPTDLDTDQWVEAAASFGATEICLTAHHEGGFCLWDTQYSNYTVMHSPYGKDIVAQFVASCKKFGVSPCYYMGPNANGYLSNELKLPAEEFVSRQLGMLRELLTKYGTDYVSRLWWDHYPSGCGGLAPCPTGSFPAAWPRFVQLVREVSPSTIICPGPDCDGHQGEGGQGKYPVWYPCSPSSKNGTELSCGGHAPSASLTGFHPYETCATMHNGWFCKGNGTASQNSYWTPSIIWDHYMYSVGIGYINTLNAPPGTTGQIPEPLVKNMAAFGMALRTLLAPVAVDAEAGNTTLKCSNSTTLADADAASIELQLSSPATFNAVITVEELSAGQAVTSYVVEHMDAASGSWVAFPRCGTGKQCVPGAPASSGGTIPRTPKGACSATISGVNLVYDAPPSAHAAGTVKTAAACEALCAKDLACNFWTWHDLSVIPASYRGQCWVRIDQVYDPHTETHHDSGVCNRTLGGGGDDIGYRGQSIGFKMIDWVPTTTSNKVRLRCTSSMRADGSAVIASFSLHKGERPPAGDA